MSKIVLDPGHGGHDQGAVANGLQEKDVNLAVALITRDMLQVHGVKVLMTRATDETVTLLQRTDRANRENVDAFVSIHHNAAANPDARGVEIYHSIIGSEGQRLAQLIMGRYQALIPELPSRGVKTRKNEAGMDYYHVIRKTKMPAVIIEGGFLTNPEDADLIKMREFQEKEAQAISQGILEWLGEADPRLKVLQAENEQLRKQLEASTAEANRLLAALRQIHALAKKELEP